MKRTIIATIGLSVCFVSAAPLPAQPILNRLQQRIRDRIDEQLDVAQPPRERPGQQPRRATPAPAQPSTAVAAERQPGYLGVVADDKNESGRGVRILDVRPGGPAERAGLRKQDLIVAMAGSRVAKMSDMAQVLGLFSAGDTLDFDVQREGRRLKLKVTLGHRPPAAPQPSAAVTPPATGPRLSAPHVSRRPTERPSPIETLQRRIEQLERRVAELEKSLAESRKKP